MTQEPPEPGWAPEPPQVNKGTVFKIGIVIAIILLAYWLWRIYTHLAPAQPLEYPAGYIPVIINPCYIILGLLANKITM